MREFQQVSENVYLLKTPFAVCTPQPSDFSARRGLAAPYPAGKAVDIWSGVTLITGKENVLIDSGAKDEIIDDCLVPALKKLGYALGDIAWLTQTHCHGDHIGGHHRILELCPQIRVASYAEAAPRLADPVSNAVRIRTRFPGHSPAPQSSLKGVAADKLLADGEFLTEGLRLWSTPGHDGDCVCWETTQADGSRGLICGDSLQANGTPTQGIGFYQNLQDYLFTLDRLAERDVDFLVCGHDYDGIGCVLRGRDAVRKGIAFCRECVNAYDAFVKDRQGEDAAQVAVELIKQYGCGMPEKLFLALYTVTQHMR